jgi:cobalt/nickel transport system permease protein
MTLAAELSVSSTNYLARIDPRWRLVGTLGWTCAISFVTELPIAALSLAGSIGFWQVSGISWMAVRRPLLALVPFLMLLAIPLVLIDGQKGMLAALLLVLKSVAIALPAMLLVVTSSSSQTWDALRSLGVPHRIVCLLMLSERSAVILAAAFNRTRRAMCVRGFQWKADRLTYHSVGTAIGATALGGLTQSRQLEHALACRGFNGRHHSWRTYQTTLHDIVFVIICFVAGGVVVFCNWMQS